MSRDRAASHVLAEQQQRPPDRLLDHALSRCHQRCDDIDALSNVRHANVLALSHEHVEPYRHSQSVRQCVHLFRAFLARGALWVPDVPLVEADRLPGYRSRDAVLDASEVYQTGADLDGALSGARSHRILDRVLGGRVDVDAVHVDQTGGHVTAETMQVVSDTLFECVEVPLRVASLAAQDQLDRRIQELEGFRPLVCLLRIVLLGHHFDLPRTPGLVAESPVLHVVRLFPAVLATEVGVVCVSRRVAVLEPCQSCKNGQRLSENSVPPKSCCPNATLLRPCC